MYPPADCTTVEPVASSMLTWRTHGGCSTPIRTAHSNGSSGHNPADRIGWIENPVHWRDQDAEADRAIRLLALRHVLRQVLRDLPAHDRGDAGERLLHRRVLPHHGQRPEAHLGVCLVRCGVSKVFQVVLRVFECVFGAS